MEIPPLISILTPSLNQDEFIEETILSVIRQNYPQLEHIIMDGGSSDSSIEIIKKYENNYDLKWFSEADSGQADALNKGFRLAKGDIIGWLNSDDLYEPNIIGEVVEFFLNHPNVYVLYGNCTIINEKSEILRINKGSYTRKKLLEFWKGYYGLNQPSIFYRREVFNIIGLFDVKLNFVMDYEFLLRAGEFFDFHYIDINLSRFRIHDSSKGGQGWTKFVRESIQVLNHYWIKRNLFQFFYCFFSLRQYYGKLLFDQIDRHYYTKEELPSIPFLVNVLMKNPFLVFKRLFYKILIKKLFDHSN
jgi:glycosyltransferase involved in cell wall biosynthesis